MIMSKLRTLAKRNIKKAQQAWKSMTKLSRSLAQPEGRRRQKAGAGTGEFYRVVVRDKNQFVTFRTQDVGRNGDIKRLAGKRGSGSWETQAWLIPKDDAHIERGQLVADSDKVKQVFDKQLGSKPKRVRGDRFEARPRRNVPESAKPTTARRRAQKTNIQKAQKARERQLVGAR